jgi:hypothetical protein
MHIESETCEDCEDADEYEEGEQQKILEELLAA